MGTNEFHQMITTGITPHLVWGLFTLALAFMLGWVFKGRIMDILGWFWFKSSPFDKGFYIKRKDAAGKVGKYLIEDFGFTKITFRHMDDRGRKTDDVSFLPMAQAKDASSGWVLPQAHSGDAIE
jgi:hypothetical protein